MELIQDLLNPKSENLVRCLAVPVDGLPSCVLVFCKQASICLGHIFLQTLCLMQASFVIGWLAPCAWWQPPQRILQQTMCSCLRLVHPNVGMACVATALGKGKVALGLDVLCTGRCGFTGQGNH